MDQLAVGQLRRQGGKENALRMRQIATDTHLPAGLVADRVAEHAAAPRTGRRSAGERPGVMPVEPRAPRLPSQDVGRSAAAVDPPVPTQHDAREIVPYLSDEQARD